MQQEKHTLHEMWDFRYIDTSWTVPTPEGYDHFGDRITQFNDIETFFQYFNNVYSPSKIALEKVNSTRHNKSKLDFEYLWVRSRFYEEKSSLGGQYNGADELRICMPANGNMLHPKFDHAQLHMLLAVIGETIHESIVVQGIRIKNRKRECKICLMLKDNSSKEERAEIDRRIKALLGITPRDQIVIKFSPEKTDD